MSCTAKAATTIQTMPEVTGTERYDWSVNVVSVYAGNLMQLLFLLFSNESQVTRKRFRRKPFTLKFV